MNQPEILRRLGILLAAFTLTTTTHAAVQTWNNNSADFLWGTSLNWLPGPAAWTDGNDAVFGATGTGTVSLSTSVTVQNQTFNSAGYTIAGAANVMTLAGTTPTITVNADATNSASISGTNGLTVQGTGVLSLQGDAANSIGNTYTGGTYVKSGTLMLGAPGAIAGGGASYAVDSIEVLDTGAIVKFDTSFDGTTYSSHDGQIGAKTT